MNSKQTEEKGDLGGECYRTACQNKNAGYYNHSTRKHYCQYCATLINNENRTDAMRLYGHDLCTQVIKPVKERDDFDLLELVCQLHARACCTTNKEMHDAYVEARKEMEARLSNYAASLPAAPIQKTVK